MIVLDGMKHSLHLTVFLLRVNENQPLMHHAKETREKRLEN